MKTGSFTVWKSDVVFLLFRQKGTAELCLILGNVSEFVFVFDSQINTILFITLH